MQPAGLVPAAVFVLLNLAFVYPTLKAAEVGYVTIFTGLDEAWQGVTVAVIVLFLGYLLLSVSANVLDLLAGDSWRDAALYGFLQGKVRDGLDGDRPADESRATDNPWSIEALGAAWDLRSAYPVRGIEQQGKLTAEQVEDVGPTGRQRAPRPARRSCTSALGHRLRRAVGRNSEASTDKEAPALAAAERRPKASLDHARRTLAFVLGAFGAEVRLVPVPRLWVPGRARCRCSRSRRRMSSTAPRRQRPACVGATLRSSTVVDLGREDLRKKLGELRELTRRAADERRVVGEDVQGLPVGTGRDH